MDEIKEAVGKGNVFFGARQALRAIKKGEAIAIFISKNCREDLKNEITKQAKGLDVPVKEFDGTSKQLGIFCGKPFSIAVLTIKK